MITVSKKDFDRQVIPDSSPDPSYLEQDGFEERLAEYRRGEFGYVGVRASVELPIPYGKDAIQQTISSPGLWGIESDSGDEYFGEVFKEESDLLAYMLEEMGVKVVD